MVTTEDILQRDAAGYAERIVAATKEFATDPVKLVAAMDTINKERMAKANEEVGAARKAAVAETEKYKEALEAFQAHVKDALTTAWDGIDGAKAFNALPGSVIKRLVFAVDRNADDGKANAPIVSIINPTKVRTSTTTNGNGGPRSQTLTVDGTEYASANAAKEALLPDKAGKGMNRAAIISGLKAASHNVTE
jgi:hypothetical protein